MDEKKKQEVDQPDTVPAGQLDEQDLDSVAGGKVAKIDAFTIKQGIAPSTDSEVTVKGR